MANQVEESQTEPLETQEKKPPSTIMETII
jgi:hypothetical protein